MDTASLECICEKYLNVLDTWQSDVYNIRIMHHEVWRDLNHVEGIIERRAGSRVEKQTRVLPVGGKADVDYMFQVDRVSVGTSDGDGLVYETSSESRAYGKVFVSKDWVESLVTHKTDAVLSSIFHRAFQSDEHRDKYVLKPNIFKENIFSHCKFEMQRNQTPVTKTTSPSVSGQGALNEYDVVPCLKLDRWPDAADDWQFKTKDDSYTIGPLLRRSIVQTTPILLVPTGNPLSPTAEDEWRLSFSFVEIEIFNNLIPKQRQLYGILKYLFKELFSEIDLLSSYHIKTLMLSKVDREPLEYWERVRLRDFIVDMFQEMLSVVDNEYIQHLFISSCNIFPLHKSDLNKKRKYKDIVQNGILEVVAHAVSKTLFHDLSLDPKGVDLLKQAEMRLQELAEVEVQESYVSGYLTRLLSVSWYCLQEAEQRGALHRPINQLKILLERYKDDKNIQRLIPMLDVLVSSMTDNRHNIFSSSKNSVVGFNISLIASKADKLSTFAHLAYVLYLKREFPEMKEVLSHMEPLLNAKDSIGVTVTKLQVDVDYPIDYLTAHMVKDLKSNRMYIEPKVMYLHLTIQSALRESILTTEKSQEILQSLMSRLVLFVKKASENEPYLGKLSYKHAEVIFLQGYGEYFRCKCTAEHGLTVTMPEIVGEDSLRKRDSATNFNLR